MTDRTRMGIGRGMAFVGVATSAIGSVWLLALGLSGVLWEDWIIHNALVAIGTGVIVWLVVASQPRNSAVWLLAWTSILTGFEVIAYATVSNHLLATGIDTDFFSIVPAELPTWIALVAMQANWLWMGIFVLMAVLHVFPDGRTKGGAWSVAYVSNLAAIVVSAVGLFWLARPSGTIPLGQTQDTHGGFESFFASMVTVGYPLSFLLGVVGVAAMILRFRKSTGVVRQQFRWVSWGAAVAGVTMTVALVIDEVFDRTDIALVAGAIAFTSLILAIGIAIGKYRLYDIDVVISRTFVYGTLAAFIGVVYVGIVVGVGYLLGAGDQPNDALGVLATVVIAVAFQPLRRQIQRVANRLVYGRRATPYEVLSTFSQGIAAVDPGVLTHVARSLAEGTTAQSASVWIYRSGTLQCVASWPVEAVATHAEGEASQSVMHDGEELGRVTLEVPPGQPFPVTDRRLLEQVAGGLGLALRNMQLTDELRDRVDELAASRKRIVTVQDETRRKLERDLHDGAQQRLVALKIKLGIGASMAEKAGLDDLKAVIDMVRSETDGTIESVRDFARGIYPPLLEAEGLGAALGAQARKMPIPVTVQAAGVGRYAKDQEATVYFCVLEGLQNAIKHSQASSVQVLLTEHGDELTFEVRDDGRGFVTTNSGDGGLVNMRDRVEAVGGDFDVYSEPGRGTNVSGRLPVSELVVT